MSVASHTHELVVGWTWTWHPGGTHTLGPLGLPNGSAGIILDEQKLYVRVGPSFSAGGLWHGGYRLESRDYGEHVIAITRADIAAAAEKTYTTIGSVTNRANHMHEITITVADFVAIAAIGLADLAAGIAIPLRSFSSGPQPGAIALTKTTSASVAVP